MMSFAAFSIFSPSQPQSKAPVERLPKPQTMPPASGNNTYDRLQTSKPESGNSNYSEGFLQGLRDSFGGAFCPPVTAPPQGGAPGGGEEQGGAEAPGKVNESKKRRRVRKGKNQKTKTVTKRKKSEAPQASGGSKPSQGGNPAPGQGQAKPQGPAQAPQSQKPQAQPQSQSKPQQRTNCGFNPAPNCSRPPSAGNPAPKPGVPKPGATRPGVPQPGMPQTGVPKPDATRPGVPQPGMPQTGTPRPGAPTAPSGSSPAQPGRPAPSTPPGTAPQSGTPAPGKPGGSTGQLGSLNPQLDQWDPQILESAERWGVPPERIKAMMAIESGGDPGAYQVNPTHGDTAGLMQINQAIWGEKAASLGYDLNTPDGQIGMAAYLLRQGYETTGSWDGASSWYFNPSGTGDSVNGTSNAQYVATVNDYIAQMGG